jgi:hypothetical protein
MLCDMCIFVCCVILYYHCHWVENYLQFWYKSNITLHNDLRVPYVTEVIRTYAKNHRNRTKQNKNQLIRDLFNQPETGRRLNRMWPEDLIR